ncbi:flagellar M-ring protein FliF [Aliifodinibius sp. S!AR15-10]|uniref:flagellar basal-body MS-ring/collar protein FliF n=1 Tax=Aliifodinibius sp. S!AR15-10 TaxID=2950437 RepID=UPI002864839E|nr:flagellar basal-body MS-ring/collar protein FliF [Aliifodinibius sp. S!AR15-10]MDR8394257.1 flagellar M-ring protein FliF [Aliifodinibius sp. S!AR15-10]
MNKFTKAFQDFFAPLSSAQKAMFVGLTVAIVIFVGSLFYWALKPTYTLLFGSLQNETAQEIVQELDSRGVNYQLKNGGQSIYVPSDQANELRIQLAPMGAPQSDMKGYELFDSNSLGMTDFMQQVNNRRALEGELARTVNSLEQVESSRIHLVLPERSPFKQSTVKASASVVLTIKQGEELSKKNVNGITSLIAGSVEGLDASNVAVIDHNGNRLTDGTDSKSEFASGDLQMTLRKKTEAYLTERGQTMLDRVLGPGNSMLRVSVEQDFDSLVRRSNNIEPESRTLISEQRSEQIQNDEGREMVPVDEFTPAEDRGETVVVSTNDNESTSRTRNYEVNQIEEVFKKSQGEIERLSASVVINYKQTTQQNEEGQEVTVSEPYSEEEMEEFRQVVSSALGIQPNRGDQLTIKQVEFWDPTRNGTPGSVNQPTPWNDIIRWGLIISAFLAILALINSIRKRISSNQDGLMGLPDGSGQVLWADEVDGAVEGMDNSELKEQKKEQLDENRTKQLEPRKYDIEDIKNFVELKPREAAKVVRVMLAADEE